MYAFCHLKDRDRNWQIGT